MLPSGEIKANLPVNVTLLQHQQTLRPHIEQKVYDTQVGQKPESFLKYLIIGLWRELCIFQSKVLFRMNAFAEVCFIRSEFSPVFRGTFHIRLYIYQGTDEAA